MTGGLWERGLVITDPGMGCCVGATTTPCPSIWAEGTHTASVVFTSMRENLDGAINTALLDPVRLTVVAAR
ncbi:MAG: hypothetical protein IH820_17545 [Bacteroidetes bacterium]|nr:hypothetical protein [Bacteroidota bacterium]